MAHLNKLPLFCTPVGLHLVVQAFMFRLGRALRIQHVSTDMFSFFLFRVTVHKCSDTFETLGFYVVQNSVFGSTAMYWRVLWLVRLLCRGLRFCGTVLVGCHPYTLYNSSDIFSAFSVCPTVLVYANECTLN